MYYISHELDRSLALSPAHTLGITIARLELLPKTLLPPGTKQGDIVQNELGSFATVAEVGDMMAVLDYNHPLAGKPLIVQLKILKVENP
jgi:FKBP-type peptidyl-prolyl cis-trans isomerase 2